jgi:S-adenosylmethionine synthetase
VSVLDDVLVVSTRRSKHTTDSAVQLCEHKGIGHPDSICDGVAEAVARALCREYLARHGEIEHFNVDKALLVGGASTPRFGGGTVQVPMRLILAGRATPIDGMQLSDLVQQTARNYLTATLHCDAAWFEVECAIRPGSSTLRQSYAGGRAAAVANDTSIGAAYAPHSRLEQMTLRLAEILRSTAFRSRFAAAGQDYKVMGALVQGAMHFTVALAFVDRETFSVRHYFELKAEVVSYLEQLLGAPGSIALNTLDSAAAASEGDLYLTVTGLSAEQGDDGEVGRGNRINGLITPTRPMSLEAVCGKNPVGHVGKVYNVLAREIAREVSVSLPGISYASVQILSAIGRPIAQPQLIAIEIAAEGVPARVLKRKIHSLVEAQFQRLEEITHALINGQISLF